MKKIISLVCSVAMVLTVFTAFCALSVTSFAAANTFKAVKLSAELGTKEMLDGDKYKGADSIPIDVSCKDEAGVDKDGATGIARAGFTDQALYVWVRVNDSTRSSNINEDKPWENDSVEIYVDFNNNKTEKNLLTASKSYSMQYRINRQGKNDSSSISPSVSDIADAAQPAGEESGNYYIVAVRIPFKADSTDARPVSTKIGFAVQINDNMDDDDTRDAKTCTSNRAGQAHKYTSHFETLELPGFTNLSTREVVTKTEGASTVSYTSNALVSSTKSGTSSKATSSAVTTSTSSTSSGDTATTVSDAGSTETPSETVESDTQTNSDTQTIGAVDTSKLDKDDEGGLPLGALIGIIAGAVVILAGIAVAVILIIKKKKSA